MPKGKGGRGRERCGQLSFTPSCRIGYGGGRFRTLQTNKRRFERIAYCGVDWLLPLAFTRELAMMRASAFIDMLIEKLNPQEVLLGYDNRFGKRETAVSMR